MAQLDEEELNFQLVSTYVPLVLLLARSVLLLTAAQFVAEPLEEHGALMLVLVVAVYFDAHVFRHNRLNQACGFLCPVALCVLQGRLRRVDGCDTTFAQVALWAVDMVWAISCTSYVAIVCYKGYFVVRVVYAAATWAVCAILHTMASCVPLDVHHQIVRTVLYYLACTLFFYFRYTATCLERGSRDRSCYQQSVLHIFLHVFYVQHYVLLGSVVMASIVFGAAYYVRISGHGQWLPPARAGKSEPAPHKTDSHHPSDAEADMAQLRELRAAMHASAGEAAC